MDKVHNAPAIVQRKEGVTHASYKNKSACSDPVEYDNLNNRDHIWESIPLPGAGKWATTNQMHYDGKDARMESCPHTTSKTGSAVAKNHFYGKARPAKCIPEKGKIKRDFMGSNDALYERHLAQQLEQAEMQKWQEEQGCN